MKKMVWISLVCNNAEHDQQKTDQKRQALAFE